MKCANCQAVLSGEPTCPSCGTLYTVSRARESLPAIVEELESRLGAALEGRYELRGLLGHGGMGAVFLAVELSLDRLVAIKVLPPSLSMDEELLGRFQREARTAARLDHRGIVPIYSVEAIDGLHFYVMKFVAGTDLSEEIPEGGMSPDRARQLLWESAVSLGHAHRRGVIHRDVKPANIMIDQSGRALLTDFGIAKAVRGGPAGTAMTSTGQMIGTPQYMSPEQMEGRDLDGRADQYSLGMVAWHMLAGRQPFQHGSVAALLVKQLNEYPESLAVLRPNVPDDIVGTIERAIRKDPDERFDSMEDFARALWPEQAGAVEGGAPPTTRATASRSATTGSRPKWIPAAAAIAVLAIGGVVGTTMLNGGDSPDSAPAGSEGAPIQEVEPARDALPTSPPAAGAAGAGGGVSSEGESSVSENTGETNVESSPTEPQPAAAPPQSSSATASSGVTADAVGFLSIFSRPFAFVAIDGIDHPESTPINGLELSAGQHVLTIRREGCSTVVDTVAVTPGNTTTRTHTLICN